MTRSNSRSSRHLRIAVIAALTILGSLPSAAAATVLPAPITDGGAAPAAPTSSMIKLTVVASALSKPLLVTSPRDGTNRLFIVEQTGKIRIVKGGSLLATPFLDMTPNVRPPAPGGA